MVILTLNSVANHTSNISNQTFPLNEKMREQAYYLIGLALCSWLFDYLRVAFWLMAAERQSRVIRKKVICFQILITLK